MVRKKAARKFTEDDERKQKLEVLLKQFDMEVGRRVYEMHRATEQTCAHIDSMLKLARLKIPSAQREELWEGSEQTAPAEAVMSAADAVLVEAERAVQQQKAPRGRGRPRATPSSSCDLVTPLQPPRPLHASTPAVTPKFDPLTVQRRAPSTIRRNRPREVLMSLKGSPVMGDMDAATAASRVEPKQLVKQTVELLRQESELDEETQQLIASLRDQLIDMTSTANEVI